MKFFVIGPNCSIRHEERERIKMEIVKNWRQRRCQAHEEGSAEVERASWYYVDWLANRYQVIRVKRGFVTMGQIESRAWYSHARCLGEIML